MAFEGPTIPVCLGLKGFLGHETLSVQNPGKSRVNQAHGSPYMGQWVHQVGTWDHCMLDLGSYLLCVLSLSLWS